MSNSSKKVLVINGSIRGKAGNSWTLVQKAAGCLEQQGVVVATLTLTDPMLDIKDVYELLKGCDGILVVTGVYWNSWGSPLQFFLEVCTAFENTPAFFGKPVACAVTMDSVGGTDVASGLHAALAGLGCWSPPCSTIVLSRVGQEAIEASAGAENNPNDDVWRMDDLEIVLKNLVAATAFNKAQWVAWPHVKLRSPEKAWPSSGEMDLGTPKFI